MSISPQIWRSKHPNFLTKKQYEYLRIELGNNTYTHTIFQVCFRIQRPFIGIGQSPQFSSVLTYGSRAQSTKKKFQKNFMRTSVLSWEAITYTRTYYFTPISTSSSPFQKLPKFLNFSCVDANGSRAWSNKQYCQKFCEELLIKLGNHHVYSHYFFQAHFCIY